MRILLIGSGGREHALAWKLAQSRHCEALFAAPGNPGIAAHAKLAAVDMTDKGAIVSLARAERIDLAVIGPEQPLVEGLADALADAGLPVFGPSAAAARLEGSKSFTKALCAEFGIPTAKARHFTSENAAAAYIREQGAPIVVKADGLAAGKGVSVAATVDEALAANVACFASDPAGGVVIEERLRGTEASLFALSDGDTVIPFGTAQDYKRAFDGDQGPNTGGMGAISPAPALSSAITERAMDEIVRPAIAGMKARGTPFRGVLYAGLMITREGPKLIEYNVRFGDPECQVLMPRLESDLAEILAAAANGKLAGIEPRWSRRQAVTVTMANPGYPGAYEKGGEIRGIDAALRDEDVVVFQAGTTRDGTRLLATGGRVLNVTALGDSPDEARQRAYEAVARIDWPGVHYRTDIAAGGSA
jgi:phosphoribosylamine--glycine ligase